MEKKKNIKEDKHISLFVSHSYYDTLSNKSYELRKPYAKKNLKLITAFIPGNILEIYVKKGDRINTETCLVILEAMKMKNKLFSSIDGVVKEIHCNIGDMVKNKQILIELE